MIAETESPDRQRSSLLAKGAITDRREVSNRELPNIYHIVLDEFQTDFFHEVDSEKLREQLAGFRFFPDATTPFGRTEMALAAMFSGVPYDYEQAPIDYMMESYHGSDSLALRLKAWGYWTAGYLHSVYPRGATSSLDETFFHRDVTDLSYDTGRGRLFLSMWSYATLPSGLARSLIPDYQWQQLESQTLLPDAAPFWSLQSFRRLITDERRLQSSGPRYTFAHFILPHFPAVLKEDCTPCAEGETNQTAQAKCALYAIVDLTRVLQENGTFRESLILVHGDHGARHYRRDGKLVPVKGNFYSSEWSWGRSRILMLVKPPGLDGDTPFRVDHREVDLYDIYPTMVDAVGMKPRGSLVGTSLLGPPAKDARTRAYHFYDKDRTKIIDGSLKRYRITGGRVEFDAEIQIGR